MDPRVTIPPVSAHYTPRTRALTVDEVRELLVQLQPDRAAQVAWMVAVAGDWSAVARAVRSDVSEDFKFCRVRGTKPKTPDRVVPLILPACQALLAFAVDHGEGRGDALSSVEHGRSRHARRL